MRVAYLDMLPTHCRSTFLITSKQNQLRADNPTVMVWAGCCQPLTAAKQCSHSSTPTGTQKQANVALTQSHRSTARLLSTTWHRPHRLPLYTTNNEHLHLKRTH